jgi:MFS family permease
MPAAPKPALAQSYAANVVLVILTLFPGLINTSAISLDASVIGSDLHVAPALAATLPLLSDAALAFGCVLAAELGRRVEGRLLFYVLLAGSLISAFASATATAFPVLLAAHVVHGLLSGMLFVVVVPPLLTTFGSKKLGATASVMVPALFGASTLGPPLGAVVAFSSLWRVLFAAEVGVALIAMLLAALTLQKREPQATNEPLDWGALLLAALGSAGVYMGTGRLANSDLRDPLADAAIVVGMAAYAALIATEAAKKYPLVPVRKLATSVAIIGTIATVAGSVSFAALNGGLMLSLLRVEGLTPHDAGLTLWPEFLAAVASGFAFGQLVTTRWVILSGAAGLVIIAAAALCARALAPVWAQDAGWIGAVGAFGAGLSVSPGLFVVTLSFERALVGRAIALLNLFRLTGGFISVPGVQFWIGSQTAHHLAAVGAGPAAAVEAAARAYVTGNALPAGAPRSALPHALSLGIADADVLIVALTAIGLIAIVALLRATHLKLRAPDLERFDRGEPALGTPALV